MADQTRLDQLEAFFDFMYSRAVMDGGDIDYFDVVVSMERNGLVKTEPYDLEKHGEIEDAEPGDPITVKVKP